MHGRLFQLCPTTQWGELKEDLDFGGHARWVWTNIIVIDGKRYKGVKSEGRTEKEGDERLEQVKVDASSIFFYL